MKKVQKTTQNQQSTQNQQYSGNQTNKFDWMNTPINAEMQSVIDAANAPTGADPAIAQRFAGMEEDVRRSKMDPLGAFTTPFVRERSQLSDILKLGATRDKAMREDAFNQQQGAFSKKLAAAQMTGPRLIQTGSTSSGNSSGTSAGSGTSTTSTGNNLFGDIFGMATGAIGL